jgi:hypothetical protein
MIGGVLMTTRQPIRAEKPATAIHLGTGDTAYRRLAALDALAAHLGYTNLDGKAMRSRLFQAIADGDVALARSVNASLRTSTTSPVRAVTGRWRLYTCMYAAACLKAA